jgi:hypothetical protein
MRFALDSLELEPFFELHDARYQMYFQTFTKDEFKEKQEILRQQEIKEMALEANTIDKINCGEQQPEVDHLYRGEKSNSGYDDGRFWRNTQSYISYQMINKDKSGKYLDISILDTINANDITITINNKPAEIISLENKKIRLDIAKQDVIAIKITAKDGKVSPKFYQLRIVKN